MSSTASISTPPPGSQARKDVLNAIRPSVAQELGRRVEFVVSNLRVGGGFAFVFATAQQPGGRPIDDSMVSSEIRKPQREGLFDGYSVLAFLKKTGDSWKVLEEAIGPTDFPAAAWAANHGAPSNLVG